MGKLRTIQTAFGAGRMSPNMYGRPDDARQRNGLAECSNMWTTVTGACERRTGTEFCIEAKDSARAAVVRPFITGDSSSVVLILNGWDANPSNYGTIRFLVNGRPLLYVAGSYPLYRESSTVTISNSGGGELQVNWTLQPFTADDQPVAFTTTNVLGYGLVAGQVYYVRVRATNSFQIAATPGGPAIPYIGVAGNSGTTSGHAYYQPGDIVQNSTNYFYCREWTPGVEPGVDPGWQTYWYQLPASRELEIPHQYLDADLTSLSMRSQASNVLTITHRNYQPRELVRLGPLVWAFRTIAFASPVGPPAWSSDAIVPYAGRYATPASAATAASPTRLQLTFASEHTFRVGDTFYAQGFSGGGGLPDGFYSVGGTTAALFDVRTVTGEAFITTVPTVMGTVRLVSPSATLTNFYRITSLDADGRESYGGPASGALNPLVVEGAYNTLSWLPVVGASLYRIYRAENGRYFLIGETGETTFRDVGGAPDYAYTLPEGDVTIGGTANDWPATSGNFEGRQLFGGTTNRPQTIWGTRSGTSADLSYHIPLQPDDRLNLTLKSNRPCDIRHLIPMSQTLVAMTSTEEFRIASPDGVALTADTTPPARSITSVGSSQRGPVVVGGAMVFEANRGGHVRELGFRSDTGWIVGDVSARCADWFDGYDLADGIFHQQAPVSTLWMVRSDGRLLGFTYAPEEGVGGWHEHTTAGGTFESVCVVPEGDEDSVYLIVRRTINGSSKRYVERMAPRLWLATSDRRFVDCHLTYDGTNTTATTLTLTGGTTYAAGQTITLTASSATFAYPATTDVGDRIKWLGLYRVRITATSSTTVATGVIEDSFAAVPSSPSAVWTWGRDTIAGLSHLEGQTVQVVADGVYIGDKTVASGSIALGTVGYKVHVGLGYTARMVTLPLGLQIDGLGHGRKGNIVRLWPRIIRSSSFEFGPLGAQTLNDATVADVYTGEVILAAVGDWSNDKQLVMQQPDPLPLSVASLTLETTLGD